MEEFKFSTIETMSTDKVLTVDSFRGRYGFETLKDINLLLSDESAVLSLPIESTYRQDYEHLRKMVTEKRFGLNIKDNQLELCPLKIEDVNFLAGKIFTHETTDMSLAAIDNPSDNFTYIAVEGSSIAHGNLNPDQEGYVIEIDAEKLFALRSVYLDPESIPFSHSKIELGKSFIFAGGIPKEAVRRTRKVLQFGNSNKK